jgi:IS30 family transposase
MAHLTLEQRYEIEVGIAKNMSQTEIALEIGKNKSVINREIKRNSDLRNNKYSADLANKKAQTRHISKPKKKHWNSCIQQYVNEQLEEGYSPEQISGRARIDNIECVSHERIYQYIWKDKKSGGSKYKLLRNKGKRYRKRGNSKDNRGLLSNRVDIDQRPAIVDYKDRFGDLEIDLVIGKGHKHALLTINDRATGLLFMAKVDSKQASEIEAKTFELLHDWIPFIHTITSDNGKEFANHEQIAEKLIIAFYFAKPYHSWQRGANENLNGLVRQYFPKDYDFSLISSQHVNDVVTILNNRPRKRFGFKTPNEVFAQKLDNSLAVAFID